MTLFAAASIYWNLPILLIAVSLVYSATRHDRWDRILKEAATWILRMTFFLGGLGGILYILSTYPHLWPYAAAIGIVGTIIYYAASTSLFRKRGASAPQAKL